MSCPVGRNGKSIIVGSKEAPLHTCYIIICLTDYCCCWRFTCILPCQREEMGNQTLQAPKSEKIIVYKWSVFDSYILSGVGCSIIPSFTCCCFFCSTVEIRYKCIFAMHMHVSVLMSGRDVQMTLYMPFVLTSI